MSNTPKHRRTERQHMGLRTASSLFAVIALAALGAFVHGCAFDPQHLRAAHDLECASDKLEVTEVDDDRVRYAGCGKTAVYYCAIDAHGYRRCKREMPNPRAVVQEVAGKDFSCPKEQIVVDDVKGGFSAKGCNRSDEYSCAPVLSSYRCTRLPASGSAVSVSSASASSSAAPAASSSAK